MKKINLKNIIAVICFVIMGLTINLQAQTKQYYSLGWEVGIPVGSFSDYISETSFRGGYFSGNVFVAEQVSIGFKFGYNSYNENKSRETHYLNDGMAVTAASYNYMINAPMQLGAYYHMDGGMVEPYIGLGLGLNYITEETIVQDWDNFDDQWAFFMSPELGLRCNLPNSPIAILLKASYNYNINSYTAWKQKYDNLQTINIGLGLSWVIKR